jgi:hypothetical protein
VFVKKNRKLLLNLLGVGLDSKLAQKAIEADFTLTRLRRVTKGELARHLTVQEVQQICDVVKRKKIPTNTLQRLVEECDWKCCVCWDYRKESPVVIHHIERHSSTSDDSYENLVILCLNHHATAHSKWEISRHPLPPELIRAKKRE